MGKEVVRHKVVAVERPLFVPYHRLVRDEAHPRHGIGHGCVDTNKESFLILYVALVYNETCFVIGKVSSECHMGKIVKGAGAIVHIDGIYQIFSMLQCIKCYSVSAHCFGGKPEGLGMQ